MDLHPIKYITHTLHELFRNLHRDQLPNTIHLSIMWTLSETSDKMRTMRTIFLGCVTSRDRHYRKEAKSSGVMGEDNNCDTALVVQLSNLNQFVNKSRSMRHGGKPESFKRNT